MDIERYDTLKQTRAHEQTSGRYAFVPTSRMLSILSDYGWLPTKVHEAGTRIEDNKGFQKHLIRLRNSGFNMPRAVGEYVPEIILINSHMGTSAFKLMCGVYRLVCSNGLTVGENWDSESIRHSGFANDKAEVALQRIIKALPQVTESVERFRSIGMNDMERKAYAESALELIKDDDGRYTIRPDSLLSVRRWADKSDTSLWGTFNVVQENVIRGGIRRVDANGRRGRTREVKNIDRNQHLNQALWALTEKMADLKQAA